jgi:cytoskeletal protein RodZ
MDNSVDNYELPGPTDQVDSNVYTPPPKLKEDQPYISRRLALPVIVILLLLFIITSYFYFHEHAKVTSFKKQVSTLQNQLYQAEVLKDNQSRSKSSSSSSSSTQSSGGTTSSPSSLQNTGPGNVPAIFIGSAIIGTIGYSTIQRRRLAKK